MRNEESAGAPGIVSSMSVNVYYLFFRLFRAYFFGGASPGGAE
jgi:hypothetical protein